VQAFDRGEVPVTRAARIAQLPKAEQRKHVESGFAEPRPRAKPVRNVGREVLRMKLLFRDHMNAVHRKELIAELVKAVPKDDQARLIKSLAKDAGLVSLASREDAVAWFHYGADEDDQRWFTDEIALPWRNAHSDAQEPDNDLADAPGRAHN
jgi:hypothetical protein